MAASISISVISFMLLSASVTAINFQVGGRDGWVVNPSESYDHWAQRLRFRVNDSLVFKYKEGEDSVVEVKKADYDECDVSNPVRTMRSGSSVVRFDRSGPFYFVSGKKKNCVGGQKLVVVVLAVRPAIRAPPSSSPVPSVPPKSQAPSPSPVPSVPPKSQAPSPGGAAPEFAPRPSAAAPTPSPISATPASSPSPISVTPTPSPAPISYTPASSPSQIPATPASSPSPISATPTPSPAPFSSTPASSPSPVSSAPSLAPQPSGASSPGNSPAGAPVASPAPAPPGEQNSPPAADQISPADSSNTTSPGSSTAWRGLSGSSPASLIVVGVAGLLTFVM
ncbi:Early nodulin-like protein 2 [Linum perenne]